MPRVKIDYVVSFSSEDAENPASNLLSEKVSTKRWLCSSGEPSCSVVVQLARSCVLSSLQVGVQHAALLEVLAGRSETPNEPYKVLVPSCVFLSPIESRRGEGIEKVRSFTGDQLAADVRHQKWDRLRIYGLSFIHIFEPEGADSDVVSTQAPTLPTRLFTLDTRSSDEEDTFKPGELFARHLKNKSETPTSTETQIRQASSQAIKNISDSATKLVKTPISKERTGRSKRNDSSCFRDRNNLMYDNEDEKPHHRIDKVLHTHGQLRDNKDNNDTTRTHTTNKTPQPDKHRHSDGDVSNIKRKGPGSNASIKKDKRSDRAADTRKVDDANAPKDKTSGDVTRARKRQRADDEVECSRSSSPHELLRGVVFAMSGYENPRRAAVRDKALALGAAYSRDWGPACTHLICAFPNTPKLRAVRAGAGGGGAVVVQAEWVEESCARRRLLPWQWFATEPERRVARPPRSPRRDTRSECDTDDEIEEALQKRNDRAATSEDRSGGEAGCSGARPDDSDDSSSTLLAEGDEAGAGAGEVVEGTHATLPDFLEGLTFLIDAESVRRDSLDVRLLARYVRAYGGELVESPSQLDEGGCEVSYVLCGAGGAAGGAARGAGGAVAVRADWLWRCHHKRRLCSTDNYLIQ